jgi:Response regulator containing CheY-like receiver, AAA-type ATPase, and DNA-binding domains
MLPILERAMGVRRLKVENVRLRRYLERLTYESARYRIVGASPAARKVVALIEKVAPDRRHRASPRAERVRQGVGGPGPYTTTAPGGTSRW